MFKNSNLNSKTHLMFLLFSKLILKGVPLSILLRKTNLLKNRP